MGKKNYLVIILVAILFLIIGGVSTYLILLSDKENNETIIDDDQDEQKMEERINQLKSEYGTLEKYFNEYIKFIPLRYDDNSELSSYNVSNLTDKEISMAVWRYIYKTNDGFSDNGLAISEVNKYLKNYLGLDNYDVKLMEANDNNAFGLNKDNNNYYITAWATEFNFADFNVRKVNYDLNKNIINVDGYSYYVEMGSDGEITVDKNINLQIQYNNNLFKLIKVDIIK